MRKKLRNWFLQGSINRSISSERTQVKEYQQESYKIT